MGNTKENNEENFEVDPKKTISGLQGFLKETQKNQETQEK